MKLNKTNFKKTLVSFILILTLIIIYSPYALTDEYYADVDIIVDNSGFVTIDGVTDHPDLLIESTEIYTSKKQSLWLLNITKNEVFSDFIFELSLPQDSSINYVKSSGSFSIEEEAGNLLIKGFGENETFSVIVQYQTEKTTENEESTVFDYLTLILTIGIIILVILFFVILFFMDKKKKPSDTEKTKKEIEQINLRGLNERQKEIIKLLVKSNRALTQTEIQRELKIPKAAVSRNIRGLELKGLIEKEQIGMSNLIRIKKTQH